MYKIVALYQVPEDKEAFDRHYQEIHTPLTLKIPHMKELRVGRVFGAPAGKPTLYLQAEMVFASKADFEAGASSAESMASGKDAMSFAGKLVSVHFVKEEILTASSQ